MIIARIIPHAGLGNQMFMYAAGLSAAVRIGTELRIGAWDFDNNQFGEETRPYELKNFPMITEQQASFRELLKICPGQILMNLLCYKRIKRGDIFRRAIRHFLGKLRLIPVLGSSEGRRFPYPFRTMRAYIQRSSSLQEFERIPDNTLLIGYWESEKYFAGIADTVRRKFTFSPECFKTELSEKIRSCNSAAIHIRMGDKAQKDSFLRCSDERYIKLAIEKLSSLTENPSFFVFSDNMEWCRKNLPLIHDAEYTFAEGGTPIQDMAMMSICRHVIIGPSTFSWWAAWLNESPGKIVIAPDLNLWYKTECFNPNNKKPLLPERWIKIQ